MKPKLIGVSLSGPAHEISIQMRAIKLLSPVLEHRFAPPRKWRFDFCWPDRMVALEVDGGTWTQGRHTRGAGYERDCEKRNAATELGWRVYNVTPAMIRSGYALDLLERVLGRET